jgi:heme oxygenase
MAATATPLSARLRTQTAPLHDQAATILGLPGAIRTLDHYRDWLDRFLGLYAPLEQSLAAFGEWHEHGFALPSPTHSFCLGADLAALGTDKPGISHAPPAALPHLPTFAHALGALYVLEGSTLGGRVILRDVERRLGPQITGATRFFDGRGMAAGPAWQRFRAALDAFGHNWPRLCADVVTGAQRAFRAILAWFIAFRTGAAAPP